MNAIAYGRIPAPARAPARASARASAPRLRLTPRGRAVFGTLAVLPVLLVALLLGVGAPRAGAEGERGADASASGASASYASVSIAPGQTLWQLAESLAPEADPREVIAQIMHLNQLQSASVMPGQKLAIPPEYAPVPPE